MMANDKTIKPIVKSIENMCGENKGRLLYKFGDILMKLILIKDI